MPREYGSTPQTPVRCDSEDHQRERYWRVPGEQVLRARDRAMQVQTDEAHRRSRRRRQDGHVQQLAIRAAEERDEQGHRQAERTAMDEALDGAADELLANTAGGRGVRKVSRWQGAEEPGDEQREQDQQQGRPPCR
jgi:hypothetical protein